MTGRTLGRWWDPDEDPAGDDAPQREVRPVPPRTPASGRVGAGRADGGLLAAATQARSYETTPSRWWTVGVVACGVAVLAAASAATGVDGTWAAVAVAAAVALALLVVAEGRRPRRVVASADGVEVTGRRSGRRVAWAQVRRVRRRGGLGLPDVDTYLELDDGELVQLPKATPGGVVEAWRAQAGGARPAPGLPQVWRFPTEEDVNGPAASSHFAVFAVAMLMNLLIRVVDLPLPVFLAGFLVLLAGLLLAQQRIPRTTVTADHDGLSVRAWRTRRTAWTQVRDVRRKGRYDAQVVLELDSGEQREVLGPDEDVVRGWWRLAVPSEERRPGSE